VSGSATLQGAHDALLVDLDGVVQLGREPIPGAAEALAAARSAGMRLMFVTNNAARTPHQVADTLRELGVQAADDEVLTSSTATAAVLAARLPAGSRVLVVGGDGLRDPLRAQGLVPVETAEDEPVAVVQGWSPDLTWALLAEGAVAVRRGCAWVATNRDASLPSPRGPLPGNGAMVCAIAMATGAEPEVVGKPGRALFDEAVRRTGAQRALVIGDRLDTDIAGANAAGLASLLVLSGVSSPDDLVAAVPEHRPTYVGRDLSALLGPVAPIAAGSSANDGLDDVRAHARSCWDSGSTAGRDSSRYT
jgi:HAD superfamily hydrolase (TIGR01450 family)